jgi:hypothetical protein
MQVAKGFGACFAMFMFFMCVLGFITFPYGIAIWLVEAIIIYKIFRTPLDKNGN